jgi:hypothetical protein
MNRRRSIVELGLAAILASAPSWFFLARKAGGLTPAKPGQNLANSFAKICENPNKTRHRQPSSSLKNFWRLTAHPEAGSRRHAITIAHCLHPFRTNSNETQTRHWRVWLISAVALRRLLVALRPCRVQNVDCKFGRGIHGGAAEGAETVAANASSPLRKIGSAFRRSTLVNLGQPKNTSKSFDANLRGFERQSVQGFNALTLFRGIASLEPAPVPLWPFSAAAFFLTSGSASGLT